MGKKTRARTDSSSVKFSSPVKSNSSSSSSSSSAFGNLGKVQAEKSLRCKSKGIAAKSNLTLDCEKCPSEISLGLNPFESFDRASFITQRIDDIVQFVFHCFVHDKVIMYSMGATMYFPFLTVTQGDTVTQMTHTRLKDFYKKFGLTKNAPELDVSVVHIMYIQIPPAYFLCRYTYRIEARDRSNCICYGSTTGPYLWFPWDSVKGSLAYTLWGPEPILLYDRIISESPHNVLEEITLDMVDKYINETLVKQKHPLTMLMKRWNYEAENMYQMFVEYITNTLPSVYMSKHSFWEFGAQSRLFNPVLEIDRLFVSFQISPARETRNMEYINFDEFLFGIHFLDPECPKTRPFLDIRISYAFRHYARNGVSLTFDDLSRLCKDVDYTHFKVEKIEKLSYDNEIQEFCGKVENIQLTYENFLAKLIQNPTKYFSVDKIVCWLVKPSSMYWQTFDTVGHITSVTNKAILAANRTNICLGCFDRDEYWLSEYCVKALYNGELGEIIETDKWIISRKRAPKFLRTFSTNFFSTDNIANFIPTVMSNLAKKKKTQNFVNWARKQLKRVNSPLMLKLIEMCTETEGLLVDQGVFVQSPAIVFCDSKHGQDAIPKPIQSSITELNPFLYPMRYVQIIEWNEIQVRGLSWLLTWIAQKSKMPTKFNLVLDKCTDQTKVRVMEALNEECQTMFGIENGTTLVVTLFRILCLIPTQLVIDGCISVVSIPSDKSLNKVFTNKFEDRKAIRTSRFVTTASMNYDSKTQICVFTLMNRSNQKCLYTLNAETGNTTRLSTAEPDPSKPIVVLVDDEKITYVNI